MAREALITSEQVYAAADAMKASGIKPTARALRERLGNVGSMATVNRLFQRWKADQEREVAAALTLPSGLQRVMLEHIDQELTARRAALEADVAELQQEVSDLATENERQADSIQDLERDRETLAMEKAAAEGKAAQLSVDLDAARAEAARERASAEAARTELAKALLKLEGMPRLEQEIKDARAELEQHRTARTAAEKQAAVLTAQCEDLRSRVDDAKAATKRAEERADRHASELAAVRVELDQARSEARTAAEAAAELRGRADRSKPAPAKTVRKTPRAGSGRSSG
jgi:chromosome segregation ATPase